MFILYANKNRLTVRQRETVTSGSVNIYTVRFAFSPDWEGLTRTAVFKAGAVSRSVLLDESGECPVPWEVLKKPNIQLQAGVYGTLGGDVVLPTIWADLGPILDGVIPGENSQPPTPDLWQQELSKKGDALGYTPGGDLGLYANDKLLSAIPISGGGGAGGGPSWGVGHGLKIVDGALTVDAVDGFTGDKTLPMTAAGVESVVGDIDVLLGTI